MQANLLNGKVAIVTGAASGIGRATAFAFADAGASVLLADVSAARGIEVEHEIAAKGFSARFVETDVADDAAVARMVAECMATFGALDFACNNAGIEGVSATTDVTTPQDWDRTLAVNLRGVWSCMRHELPHMVERGGGAIVNIASVAGLVGFAGAGAYVASKHGVVGLTKSAALEFAERGVRVNAVCPGVIDTEMITRATGGSAEAERALLELEPVRRLGTPDEIAEAVVWLCGPGSSFVTGQAIAVDGGFTSR